MTTSTMNPAEQILAQLGGRRFIAMTGAVCHSDNDGRTLIVKFKGSKIANLMYITLNEMDTYDVEICKYRGENMKTVKEVKNAYADMLKTIFETTTFLRTSLT
jgi:hypothetical protein